VVLEVPLKSSMAVQLCSMTDGTQVNFLPFKIVQNDRAQYFYLSRDNYYVPPRVLCTKQDITEIRFNAITTNNGDGIYVNIEVHTFTNN